MGFLPMFVPRSVLCSCYVLCFADALVMKYQLLSDAQLLFGNDITLVLSSPLQLGRDACVSVSAGCDVSVFLCLCTRLRFSRDNVDGLRIVSPFHPGPAGDNVRGLMVVSPFQPDPASENVSGLMLCLRFSPTLPVRMSADCYCVSVSA